VGTSRETADRARISDVVIKEDHIHFEINGGPSRSRSGTSTSRFQVRAHRFRLRLLIRPPTPRLFRRSYFDKYVPEMTGPELKRVLRPVFDFDSKSALDAYLETVSPQVKDAIKTHHVLVGMNHDMVIYAKGRPPKKVREHADEVEYEEWIYGVPPQDVDLYASLATKSCGSRP